MAFPLASLKKPHNTFKYKIVGITVFLDFAIPLFLLIYRQAADIQVMAGRSTDGRIEVHPVEYVPPEWDAFRGSLRLETIDDTLQSCTVQLKHNRT
jgi:hypothetical protein